MRTPANLATSLDLALEVADLGLWDVELATGAAVWSRRHASMQGYPADLAAPTLQHWQRLVHPDDQAGVAAAYDRASRDRDLFAVEHRVRRADTGEVRWLALRGRFVYDAEGRPVRLMGVSFDITERKLAEQALERRQAELQTMMDLLPVGVAFAHDPAASHITVNPALAKLLRVEDRDQNVSKTGPARDRLQYLCQRDGADVADEQLPMQRACRQGTDVRGEELDIVFGDGTRVTLLVSASPLFDEQGVVRGAVATHVDITALKQIQRALERADRQKDEFLAMLAHELRNPLAPIRNAAELLARLPHGNDAARAATSMIERQVSHLTRLVDDLLDVSRITRGRIELHREFIDLGEVITHAVETVEPMLRAKGHRLEVTLSHPGLVVWADRARVTQCVVNLLTNAAKYTENGGHIQVRAQPAGDAAQVEITDDGIGIEAQLLPHVFELFVQGERGLERSQGGLGIGLSVVRSLAELHGGSVAVRSDGAGKGATFCLQLPRAERPVNAQARPSLRGTSVRRRILVVDDNVDAANSLALVLRLDGHETKSVYTGRDALAQARTFDPDVVLLDIGLPEIDGYEVARQIRERVPRSIKLVAVTGYGRDDDRRQAGQAGFDAYLVKPLAFEHLERTLDAL